VELSVEYPRAVPKAGIKLLKFVSVTFDVIIGL
jgi:hypothetical protein